MTASKQENRDHQTHSDRSSDKVHHRVDLCNEATTYSAIRLLEVNETTVTNPVLWCCFE